MLDKIEKHNKKIVALLLIIFFSLSLSSMLKEGITADELPHLAAGFSYLKTFDYRFNTEHTPFVKLLSASPLMFTELEMPDDWQEQTDAYTLGKKTFYNYNTNPINYFRMARIPVMILGLILGLFIYKFAKELYGTKEALFALFLYSFSPLMIAHSKYVTTDMGVSCFLLITIYFFWKYVNFNETKHLILTGTSLGLAFATKFTGLYLIPIIGTIYFALIYLRSKKTKSLFSNIFTKPNKTLFYSIIIIGLIGVFVLMATYGFKEFDNYFDGFNYVIGQSGQWGHFQYFMGEHSFKGWWYYFPFAFLIKTPIATLGFLLLTILFYNRLNKKWSNEIFLIIPIVIYSSLFMIGKLNIGMRHLMPIYPFIFIFVSKITNLKINLNKKEIMKYILIFLSIWYIFANINIYPHYISYFNEFVGPDNGHKYLIDSNIDWGQDLPLLKTYLDENNINEPIYFAYFGADNASHWGINTQNEECFPRNGYHATSINQLMNIHVEETHCLSWLKDYEPIGKAGYSIWIYKIEGNFSGEDKKFCDEFCKPQCKKNGLVFKSSEYDNGCKCKCLGVLK